MNFDIHQAKKTLFSIRRKLLTKEFHGKKPEWYQDLLDLCGILEWTLKRLQVIHAEEEHNNNLSRMSDAAN